MKAGKITKQGGQRKSWKERIFLLQGAPAFNGVQRIASDSFLHVQAGFYTTMSQVRDWARVSCMRDTCVRSEHDAKPRGVISLERCTVREDVEASRARQQCCFALESVRSWQVSDRVCYVGRTYRFGCDTFGDMSEWMSCIEKSARWAVEDQQQLLRAGTQGVTSAAN